MTVSPYASLAVPDFRRLLIAHGTLTVAREAQIVVVGWQVFHLTHDDPLSLGLIGLAEALPFIAVALYAGHVADRATRRTIAIAGTVALLLSVVALLLLTITPGAISATRVWPVYAVIALSATARSFSRPAVFALSADVLPRELYANAVAWRTSTWHLAAVAGPAAGGMLYGFYGPALSYGVVLAVMTIGLAVLITISHRARPAVVESIPIGESLKSGIRFVTGDQVLLAAMSLDLFAVLFGGAVALLPAFAKLLDVGPSAIGILRAAPAMGAIVTGFVIAHRPPMRKAGFALFAAVAGFGVCIIAFAFSRQFWLSFALLVASGVLDNISVVIRSTLLQTRTPQHLLGRVASVNQIFIGSSNEIGAFESGLAARLLGVVPSVIFGGCMTLLVVAITAWRAPRLRGLRGISDEPSAVV